LKIKQELDRETSTEILLGINMKTLIDWIWQNKEWLFSGIGVAIIALLAPWVVRTIRARGPAIPPFDQAVFRTHPLPRKLRASIDAAPSLHQSARALEITGMKIQWKTTLEHAREKEGGLVHLMLLDRGSYPWVVCDVPKDLYPDLLLARTGTVIWVAGRIANCNSGTFVLEDPQLRIVLP
jgi:hypothetical protein